MNKNHVAFVAGATGLTGRHVVSVLRERGIDTVAHIRPDSSSLERWRTIFEEQGVEVDTMAWTRETMAATLAQRRPTIVFALLGTTKARAKRVRREGGDASQETYEAVDYGLSKILLEASIKLEHRPLFVYLSSVGVAERTRNPYLRVRAQLERELRESELPFVVARPSFIVGDRDIARPLEGFAARVGDGALAALGWVGGGRMRDRYRSTDAGVLARALVSLALDPEAVGEVFETGELHSRGS